MERGGGDIFLFYFTCLKAGIHHTLPSLSISCNHHSFGPKQSTNGNFGTASGENTRRRAWCTPIYQSLGHQEEDRYHTPQGLLDFHWVDMSCSSCVRELAIPEGAKLPSPAAAVACTKLFGGRSYVFCNESTDKKPSEPLSGGDCFACQVMDA